MHSIRKRIVTDEDSHPVAVQIDYKDWLQIERLLARNQPEPAPQDRQTDLDELLDAASSGWKGGDGLEFQRNLREEWEGRP